MARSDPDRTSLDLADTQKAPWVLFLLVVVALAIRIPGLGHGLWHDELITMGLASEPWSDLLTRWYG